ncbi:MAG TPA: response regulator [Burkholderiales bacterium]|nr:response regulator [Burkholderiales bacterium]
MNPDTARTGDLRKAVHDLRNVVAPLHNAVQLLRYRAKADSGLLPVVEIIERQVKEMVKALNTLAGDDRREEVAPAAGRNGAADGAAHGAAGRRVLIVDDNVALLTSLSSVLREAGHGVKTAEDGAAAIALAASWQPEFVLLDAHMPSMNGFEVARQLRARYPQDVMTLILMSGSSLDDATVRGAERAGFDHCVDKIHSFSSLDGILRRSQADHGSPQ